MTRFYLIQDPNEGPLIDIGDGRYLDEPSGILLGESPPDLDREIAMYQQFAVARLGLSRLYRPTAELIDYIKSLPPPERPGTPALPVSFTTAHKIRALAALDGESVEDWIDSAIRVAVNSTYRHYDAAAIASSDNPTVRLHSLAADIRDAQMGN